MLAPSAVNPRWLYCFSTSTGSNSSTITLGHEAGDHALKEVARRLQAALRTEDTAARLGGDEFTVVLEQIKSLEDVQAVGRRILSLLNAPYLIAGVRAELSASIGVSLYPDDGLLPAELLQRADLAMFRAKRAGKNQVAFHDPSLS